MAHYGASPLAAFRHCLGLGLGLSLGLAAVTGVQGQQKLPQVPIIRANTTLVDVPVLVLDKQGQPMTDLNQSDFNLFDNGRKQELNGFDSEPRPVSLAIVIDTSEWDAIDQAKRAAEMISAMVVGAQGEASIFIPGPEPKQLLPFTGNTDEIANTLRHLQKSPTAPQGAGLITEPLNLAMLDLRKQPRERTRAALVISHDTARSGVGAEALMEGSGTDAIPIFHLNPNTPANAPNHVNMDTPEERGTGQGSQRVQHPAAPVDSKGMPTSGAGTANLNLAPIIGAAAGLAGKVFAPHRLDYVFASGGVSYGSGNDREFDQRLSLIGEELRSIYHLYYSPNDLTAAAAYHAIAVELDLPATSNYGHMAYRRTYVGIKGR